MQLRDGVRAQHTFGSVDPAVGEKDGKVVPHKGYEVDIGADSGPVVAGKHVQQSLGTAHLHDVDGGVGEELRATFILCELGGVQGEVSVAKGEEGEGGEKKGEQQPEEGGVQIKLGGKRGWRDGRSSARGWGGGGSGGGVRGALLRLRHRREADEERAGRTADGGAGAQRAGVVVGCGGSAGRAPLSR